MITDNDWRTLLTKIKTGYCTPFVGAGASYPYLPLGGQLAKELIEREEQNAAIHCPLADRTDLMRITQYLAVNRRDATWPKLEVANRIKSAKGPSVDDEADPHRVLADLHLPVYLTTNYDDFLVKALLAKTSDAAKVKREFARWTEDLRNDNDSVFDEGYEPTPESPVVFHLHGHADHPLSIVITEDDYLDFLVNISKDLAFTQPDPHAKAILPYRIRRAIKTTTLLFVGYGLNDINFRVLLRGLVSSIKPSGRQIHIAVQFAGDSPKELLEYLYEYSKWTLDINILWGSARDFSTELRARMH